MSYTPTEWNNGDVITAEKLNKLENGVAEGGSGGGVLVIHLNNDTERLDKTWNEIHDAVPLVCWDDENAYSWIYRCYKDDLEDVWYVEFIVPDGVVLFEITNPDMYPHLAAPIEAINLDDPNNLIGGEEEP